MCNAGDLTDMSSNDEYAIRYRRTRWGGARIAMRAAARSPWRCAINDGAAAPAMLRAPMGKSLASTCTRHGARSIPRADIGKVPAHLGKVRRQHREVQRQLAKVKRSLGKVQRQHAKVRRQHGTVKRQHANVRRSLGKVQGQHGKVKRQHKSVPAHFASRAPHFASRELASLAVSDTPLRPHRNRPCRGAQTPRWP